MKKPRILLIEDSEEIYLLMEQLLGMFYCMDWAPCIKDARSKSCASYDIFLIDIGLPDGDGISFCSELQELNPSIPIFILTGHKSISEKVRAFMAGADDYILKPFEPIEVRARIESKLAKQRRQQIAGDLMSWRDIKIDKWKQEVRVLEVDGYQNIKLTALEFRILVYLASRVGDVVRRDLILDEIWGRNVHIYPRSVDTHVSKLRKKLGPASVSIKSIRGEGYKFNPAI